MSDFETHPVGTAKEIKLSRELANAIEGELRQYGQVIPQSVMNAYARLRQHYQWQISEDL